MTGAIQTKEHFATLDLLRGVAAIAVLFLHWFEGTGAHWFHYGHLAVDFFFLLSGFVIAYSYDDRMRKGMDFGTFFIARIIRLYPLILVGIVLGIMRFVLKDYVTGDSEVSMSEMPVSILLNLFMIPSFQGDLNASMFPLNLALWSLFFEFVAYALYGLVYWRAKNWFLILTILVSAVGVVGWVYLEFTSPKLNFPPLDIMKMGYVSGLARVMFSFFLGVWLFRYRHLFKNLSIGNAAFLSILSFGIMALPKDFIPAGVMVFCMLVLFPLIVVTGARQPLTGTGAKFGKFLGDLSYPLYVTHTPVIWILGGVFKFVGLDRYLPQTWFGIVILPVSMIIAYMAFKFYDAPLRAYLTGLVRNRSAARKAT